MKKCLYMNRRTAFDIWKDFAGYYPVNEDDLYFHDENNAENLHILYDDRMKYGEIRLEDKPQDG